MRSFTVVALLTLTATPLPSGAAVAGAPTPATCFVSAPLIVCPAGDSVLLVIVRRFDNPYPFSNVVVEFFACSSVQFPPVLGDEGYDISFPNPADPTIRHLFRLADGYGQVEFTIRAGGTCPAGGVNVYASGMRLASRAVASPDQDGNFGVGVDDVALAESKLGTGDPTADFDGDGTVTSADLDILSAHLGHHAPGMATPVAPRSWGTVKLLYR
jgi:hypothetical protein